MSFGEHRAEEGRRYEIQHCVLWVEEGGHWGQSWNQHHVCMRVGVEVGGPGTNSEGGLGRAQGATSGQCSLSLGPRDRDLVT